MPPVRPAARSTLADGSTPRRVAVVHCVGSRDAATNEYCSRACCMYSLKLSQLVHEYAGAEVHEIYRDMRSFGKGYEEFYNRTAKMGVHFYHGKVHDITRVDGSLRVSWTEAFHGQPDHVDVDMVILATGFEPQADTALGGSPVWHQPQPGRFLRRASPETGSGGDGQRGYLSGRRLPVAQGYPRQRGAGGCGGCRGSLADGPGHYCA